MTDAGSTDQRLWPRVKGNSGIQVRGEGETEMWPGAGSEAKGSILSKQAFGRSVNSCSTRDKK